MMNGFGGRSMGPPAGWSPSVHPSGIGPARAVNGGRGIPFGEGIGNGGFRGSPAPFQPAVGTHETGGYPGMMAPNMSGGLAASGRFPMRPDAGGAAMAGMMANVGGAGPGMSGGGRLGLAQAIQDWKARRSGGAPMPGMAM